MLGINYEFDNFLFIEFKIFVGCDLGLFYYKLFFDAL